MMTQPEDLPPDDERAVQLIVGRIVGKGAAQPRLDRKVIQWNTMETAKWCAADSVRLDDETMIEGARRQRRFTIDRLIKLQNEMMDEEVRK